MDRILVTTAGLAAWLAAVAVIVRLRDTVRRPPSEATTGLGAVASRVAGGVAAAMVAGMVVLGMGGRLMMRLLAATSSESVQGRITDAEEVVGEVTLGGTIGLVLFVGGFGGLLGLVLFSMLRRWLPSRSVAAGLITAGIGAGLTIGPSGFLSPDNHDFTILSPTWLAVALALALIVTFALLAAVLIDRAAASWPRPGPSIGGVAGMMPLLPLLLVPPAAVAAGGAIVFGAYVAPGLTASRWVVRLDQVMRVLVALAAMAGAGWVALSAARILSG